MWGFGAAIAYYIGGGLLLVWLYKKSKGFSIGWLVFYNLMDEVREREEEEKRRKEEERIVRIVRREMDRALAA
jgi:hypothetical protein